MPLRRAHRPLRSNGDDGLPASGAAGGLHARPLGVTVAGEIKVRTALARRRARGRTGPGRGVRASRCRRASAGLGERAADESIGRHANPLWGMGGTRELSPERDSMEGPACRIT